jgi:DNA polymerase-3 subunit chi
MTRISFYILNGEETQARQMFACRLAEKAWKQGNKIYIHTDNAAASNEVDALLWSFRDDSFVPHQLNLGTEADSPILIGHDTQPPKLMDLLINLSNTQPDFFSQFNRMAELLDDDETIKLAGRDRYRYYQQHGYAIETHKM